jgi:hypothetical protein
MPQYQATAVAHSWNNTAHLWLPMACCHYLITQRDIKRDRGLLINLHGSTRHFQRMVRGC